MIAEYSRFCDTRRGSLLPNVSAPVFYHPFYTIRTEALPTDVRSSMFKDLRAGTKFLILCVTSLALTSVATYALLAEKQIAIDFAHRELVGSKYLALLRPIYRSVLTTYANGHLGDRNASDFRTHQFAVAGRCGNCGTLHIDGIVKTLAATLRDLGSNTSAGIPVDDIYLATLKNLRDLAARIGDDLNLTLDPVLDAYHVGNIVVTRLPTVLEELGQAHLLVPVPSRQMPHFRPLSAPRCDWQPAARKHK